LKLVGYKFTRNTSNSVQNGTKREASEGEVINTPCFSSVFGDPRTDITSTSGTSCFKGSSIREVSDMISFAVLIISSSRSGGAV
jgi:hypothetical protein